MTISSTGTRYSYSGNGSTTAFSFPRQFFADGDLDVYLVNDTTGVATLQVLSTHYTVAGAGSPSGGTVTMLTAPATGNTLIIFRDTALTQSLDLDNVTSFPMTSIEAAFDRAMMAIDELATKVGRAVMAPLTRLGSFDYSLPTPVANKLLGFNSAGSAFEAKDLPSSPASINFVFDGGGLALTTGVKGSVVVPFNCTITSWTLVGAPSGSIVIDVWKVAVASYPSTVANTITGGAKPTLTASQKATSSSLGAWSASLSAGDVLTFNIDSIASVTLASLALTVTRT